MTIEQKEAHYIIIFKTITNAHIESFHDFAKKKWSYYNTRRLMLETRRVT
jgi:hypothetical protein